MGVLYLAPILYKSHENLNEFEVNNSQRKMGLPSSSLYLNIYSEINTEWIGLRTSPLENTVLTAEWC